MSHRRTTSYNQFRQANYPHVKTKFLLAELNRKRNHTSHKAALLAVLYCIRSMQIRLDNKIIQCSATKAGIVLLLCVQT